MDLDSKYYRPPEMCLALLITDWFDKERIINFAVTYPRVNDTIQADTEGYIRFDHHPTGYEFFGTIHHKGVYVDYEGKFYDANDPGFFAELKKALNRAAAHHRDCTHLRDFND